MIKVAGSVHRSFVFPAELPLAYAYYADIGRVLSYLPHICVARTYGPDQLRLLYHSTELGLYRIRIFADVQTLLEDGQVLRSGNPQLIGLIRAGILDDRYFDLIVERNLHDRFRRFFALSTRREPVGSPRLDILSRPEVVKEDALGAKILISLGRVSEERIPQLENLARPKVLDGHRCADRFLRGHHERTDGHDTDPLRISRGVEFWRQHRELLAEVSEKTGVPEEIIVAIIGVETYYGIYKGKDPVFDSLVTLAFDYPRRAKFFASELEHFLLLAKEQGFDARSLRGSYAGAMGMPQFIASSYRSYAVDFDGDGQTNLFDSIPDIAGSVANYFVRHGWERGGRVARPLVTAEKNTVQSLEPGMKPAYRWVELKQNGLASRFEIDDEAKVALIMLQQQDHPEYWAGFQNFYVITRYNHSELYAMAVYQLAKRISFEFKKQT